MSSAHQDQDSRSGSQSDSRSSSHSDSRPASQSNSHPNSHSNSHSDADNKQTGADDSRDHRRSRPAGEGRSRNAGSSIGSMISQSLAEESQAGVDRVLADVREGIDAAREYVSENPREAVALAAAAGVVAWALLGTKPGRKVFEAGAAIAVPYATKWVARNMADALR